MRKHERADEIVTDRLRSYRAALNDQGATHRQTCGHWLNNRAEN
jgi:putative transposase